MKNLVIQAQPGPVCEDGEVQEAMRAVVEFAKNEFGERADDGLRKCLEHLLVKEST